MFSSIFFKASTVTLGFCSFEGTVFHISQPNLPLRLIGLIACMGTYFQLPWQNLQNFSTLTFYKVIGRVVTTQQNSAWRLVFPAIILHSIHKVDIVHDKVFMSIPSYLICFHCSATSTRL